MSKRSYDSDISEFARWRLVPIPNTIFFAVQNRGKLIEEDPNQFLWSSRDTKNILTFLGSSTNNEFSHWRFERKSWE